VRNDQGPADSYDVAILGGGLAGFTCALQIKQARPETSVMLVERRDSPAPEAAWKVGESTQEIAPNYFGQVLGLQDHLDEHHIHKCGLRFWWPAGDNGDITQRVERGPKKHPPVPSYQIDRGRFENFLWDKIVEVGVDLMGGYQVETFELGPERHSVTLGHEGETFSTEARWIVDASGRASLIKNKLGLHEENGHNVNAAWFRMTGGLDIESWADPSDDEFFGRMEERGLRMLSTNHICGEGYWVWLIPLASGPISIGIVADPRFHPWERINTLEGALDWIREHEPQLGESIAGREDQIADYLHVENFSYGVKKAFSGSDRWCLVGEAGAFLDPFYSPGSDYISMANTFTTDLVTRDLDGEDVAERAEAHGDLYRNFYLMHLAEYESQYEFWHNPLVMNVKIGGNNIYYWGVLGLLFFHRKLTDLDFMAAVRPDLERIWAVSKRLEDMYREWNQLESREWTRAMVPTAAFPAQFERHEDMVGGFDDATLKEKLRSTAELMEAYAVLAFHRAAQNLGDAAPGEDEKINPYAVSLDPDRWEGDGLLNGEGMSAAEARQTPAAGMENLFMEAIAQPA
jgi:2-polyprenyl-6-methoxyphenol hydroxylase-like FAD-dependent oxidoreductase